MARSEAAAAVAEQLAAELEALSAQAAAAARDRGKPRSSRGPRRMSARERVTRAKTELTAFVIHCGTEIGKFVVVWLAMYLVHKMTSEFPQDGFSATALKYFHDWSILLMAAHAFFGAPVKAILEMWSRWKD